ncbi:MAG: hypothetical protein Q4B82_04780 [Alysiella sp.]|uniref:hypothetical protein n=1 Tax=Alysiella sp. TaxID=1872483 RepID=UPI0026DAD386|nr:hypothetical protein [Alysiella sp.]MDO4433877.1 hypothetical protein [Alysiella sp.]
MLLETPPDENLIKDCMAQLATQNRSSYDEKIEKYARLRLADFSALLADWQNPVAATLSRASALPQAVLALGQIKQLSAEQGSKLLQFLQYHAKQGNPNALLYLSYLYAKGLFVTQTPQKTATYLHKLAQQGDWRALHFQAELLSAAPQMAYDLLIAEIQPQAQSWQKSNLHSNVLDLDKEIRHFLAAPASIKYVTRLKMMQAERVGSPFAAQRLRGLTALGKISSATPPLPFQNIQAWLNKQGSSTSAPIISMPSENDADITILPDNIPLLPIDDTDRKPIWFKPVWIGTILLLASVCFVQFLRLIVSGKA